MNNRLIKSNDAGGGACTNTVDLYNPFPDGGGVALYQLNGDATDVSGNYDGTATNVTYGAGQFGQAGVFNGSIIQLPTSASSFNNKSFSLWFKYDYNSQDSSSFMFGEDTTNNVFPYNGIQIWSNYSNNNNLTVRTYGGNELNILQPQNRWYHLCVTYDRVSAKIYIDGSYVNQISDTTDLSSVDAISMGANPYDSTKQNYVGELDQVRIFNRALRPYEVEALYTEEYCTPTIVPSEHFNTVTYTGDSSTNRQITGVGFAPDLVWIKNRDRSSSHAIFDTVRGATKFLTSISADSEQTFTDTLAAFGSDGFTVNQSSAVNQTGEGIVAWNFKAGGAAVSNTDGTITSQVSANTEAGFSVVTYVGSVSQTGTVGHGLDIAPNVIFVKNRDNAYNWVCYFSELGASDYLSLNETYASSFPDSRMWNDTAPTSSVFTASNGSFVPVNENGSDFVAYCFAEVEGFSNFGSYVGTGTSKTIVTGFEPAFVMFKVTSEADHWLMFDNKRGVVTDETGTYLIANLSQAEGSILPDNIKFLANGFEITGSGTYWNKANAEYIYMAFAADPTTIEPTLEDSFNTVLYTGNGGTQSVTGVGFQPDFTWVKARSGAYTHMLQDSVRGSYRFLTSAVTNAENTNPDRDWFKSFDNDGFTVSYLSNDSTPTTEWNASGIDYVAWNWKGAELPAINSNGSIPSVVSANPAAGFSVVSYTGNGVNSTVGHGLGDTPKMLIIKNRDEVENWAVGHEYLSGNPWNDNMLFLNATNSVYTAIPAWGNQAPTSTTFGVGANLLTNSSGKNHIAYCFAEVAGFSKFGTYTGNGSTNGPTITTGFEPAFVMVKITSSAGLEWYIVDNKRGNNKFLSPTFSYAEGTTTILNFLENGFQITQSGAGFNGSGETYIYMAFANQF